MTHFLRHGRTGPFANEALPLLILRFSRFRHRQRVGIGIAVAIAIGAAVVGCRCEGDDNIEKQGNVLVFEQVNLRIDRATFLKTAPPLLGLTEKVSESTACIDQSTLSVPDMDEKIIVERPGTGRRLSNCRLQSLSGTQSSTVIELRAEFVDDRLARATFRFRESERAMMLSMMQKRFGTGDDMVLTGEELVDTTKFNVHYWREGAELWLLFAPESGTVLLTRQDLQIGMSLPLPKGASKKGEPVSLDDIGIGKLDLKAPLPALDLPNTGRDTDSDAKTTDG